jgi:hypothetical protein
MGNPAAKHLFLRQGNQKLPRGTWLGAVADFDFHAQSPGRCRGFNVELDGQSSSGRLSVAKILHLSQWRQLATKKRFEFLFHGIIAGVASIFTGLPIG